MKYTLVQHSASHTHAEFTHALEPASVTPRQEAAVLQAGGVLFDDYMAADDAADAAMYPPGTVGLVGRAPGRFATAKVGQRRIYIPEA